MGWICNGMAPGRSTTSDADEIMLSGIDCRPYSATFATHMYCSQVKDTLTSNHSASGFEMCQCANDNEDWATKGCCLSKGMISGADLTGAGCLVPIEGMVDTNFLGKSPSVATKLDVGRALDMYTSKIQPKSSTKFTCPAKSTSFGKSLSSSSKEGSTWLQEHARFAEFEEYKGEASYLTYIDNSRARMLRTDESDNNTKSVVSTVRGTE
jgi:hypothetical protein